MHTDRRNKYPDTAACFIAVTFRMKFAVSEVQLLFTDIPVPTNRYRYVARSARYLADGLGR
jgi:hypothetical protein